MNNDNMFWYAFVDYIVECRTCPKFLLDSMTSYVWKLDVCVSRY